MTQNNSRTATSVISNLFEQQRDLSSRESNFLFIAKVLGIDSTYKYATISYNGGTRIDVRVPYVAPAPQVDDVVIVGRIGGYEQSVAIILGKIETP